MDEVNKIIEALEKLKDSHPEEYARLKAEMLRLVEEFNDNLKKVTGGM